MEERYIKKLVIALGGNAILQHGDRGTVEEQLANLKRTASELTPLIASWYQVLITHGNGPQVGNILIQNERAKDEIPGMPLDVCGAQSQGQIGYLLQQVLSNALREMGKSTEVLTILSETIVDPKDPAFRHPSKPIGPWRGKEEMLLARQEGQEWIEVPGKGWRRTVPSPRPVRIHNTKGVETMLSSGFIVVACGGGGIPVVEKDTGILEGVEAVVDKDLVSQCLATDVGAHILLMLTDVEAVYRAFGTPQQQPIGRIEVQAMRELMDREGFEAGSIGPKVEAAVRFVEVGGEMAVIAGLGNAREAVKGLSGTIVTANRPPSLKSYGEAGRT